MEGRQAVRPRGALGPGRRPSLGVARALLRIVARARQMDTRAHGPAITQAFVLGTVGGECRGTPLRVGMAGVVFGGLRAGTPALLTEGCTSSCPLGFWRQYRRAPAPHNGRTRTLCFLLRLGGGKEERASSFRRKDTCHTLYLSGGGLLPP